MKRVFLLFSLLLLSAFPTFAQDRPELNHFAAPSVVEVLTNPVDRIYRGGGIVQVLGTGAITIAPKSGQNVTQASGQFQAPSVALGFGSTTPISGPTLAVTSTISTSPRGIASMQFSSDTAGARLGFFKARGTVASPTTVVTGDTLGRLMFRGHDGTNYVECASIEALSTGTIGTNRMPTQLQFGTCTDAAPSVLTTALTIGPDQNATFANNVTAQTATLSGGSSIGVDTESKLGNTYGKFGATFPVYLEDNYPTIGFNSYYNGGNKLGKGSTSNYGANLTFDTANGYYQWNISTSPGAADGAVTMTAYMQLERTRLILHQNFPLVWGSSTVGTPDTGLARASAGVVKVTDGATGVGAIIGGRNVVAKTTNYAVVNTDAGKFFTNTGASGEVDFTLPTAAAGLTYIFYVDAAQTLKVIAGASTTIRIAGSVSASAGNITNATTGGSIRLTAISTTQWVAENHEGTWAVN